MSDKYDDGGPAFPMTETRWNSDRDKFEVGSCGGMSLLDYFAGQALPVWIQAHIDPNTNDLSKSDIARECYSYADAMLAERKRREQAA